MTTTTIEAGDLVEITRGETLAGGPRIKVTGCWFVRSVGPDVLKIAGNMHTSETLLVSVKRARRVIRKAA